MDEIENIFKKRDQAVSKNNDLLFLGTQIEDLGSSAEGYLNLQKLESKVLSVYPEDKAALTKKVFVRETYHDQGKKPRQGFLIYYLVNTVKGWKIFKIAY